MQSNCMDTSHTSRFTTLGMLLLKPAVRILANRLSVYSTRILQTNSVTIRWGVPIRFLTTPPPMTASSDLSVQMYHTLSDEAMDSLLESLEALVDSVADRQYEVEYSSGVLTLALGSKGIYVINKQPPNKQLWLSSPVSGPKRYDYVESRHSWVYSRDGKSLGTLLRNELSSLLETRVDIDLN